MRVPVLQVVVGRVYDIRHCDHCGVVLPVDILVWVHADVSVVLCVVHDQPLKAFLDYWSENHWAIIVIQAFGCC